MDTSEAFAEYMRSNWDVPSSKTPSALPLASFTKDRRSALAAALPNALLLIPTGGLVNRSLVTEHPFRPGSDFLYLTGYYLPDAVLALRTPNGTPEATLYLPEPRNKSTEGAYSDPSNGEFWVGPRPSLIETEALLGLTCRPLSELDAAIESANSETTYVRPGIQTSLEQHGKKENHQALAKHLAILRMRKDAFEIEQIRSAITTTHKGLDAILREIRTAQTTGFPERWLEGTFTRIARAEGGSLSYDSIVAAGNHATILHWTDNTGALRDGDLLLIDAGAETANFYAADVTRTFPISGTFTSAQRDLYDLVLAANRCAIAAMTPGDPFITPHRVASKVLVDGLISLGVLPKGTPSDARFGHLRRYMPHSTSHPLGLDVHDCTDAYTPENHYGPLLPGTVLTIEPGLYFQPDDLTVPKELRGIGIRLEDDILVTEEGTDTLTSAIPIEREAIETWVQQSLDASA